MRLVGGPGWIKVEKHDFRRMFDLGQKKGYGIYLREQNSQKFKTTCMLKGLVF